MDDLGTRGKTGIEVVEMVGSVPFTVVVGVDGSPPSRRALLWAVTEARLRGGQVKVVTGWQFPSAASEFGILAQDPESLQHATERLQRRMLHGIDLEGVSVTAEAHQGAAASVLLDASRTADLLVVGSHGHGGLTARLLGSVSDKIAHRASCPVLIVRPRQTSPTG